MSDQWTERLSEYLDGDVAGEEREALEAHLDTCAECSDTLAGLRRVVIRARSLDDRPPARDLWAGIAGRIGVAPAPRRFSFSMPQLLAAGIALAVLSGGGAWILHPDAAQVATPAPVTPAGTTPVSTVSSGGTRGYDSAVNDLERVLVEGRGRLDSTTVRVLEDNLALIDRAIAQARRAVAADPANVYLNSHLAETMRRKIDLLRQAAALVSAVS
jgi:hypothetical protein